jgi:hypothetical protein
MEEFMCHNCPVMPGDKLFHKLCSPNKLGVENHERRVQPLSVGAVEFPAEARFQLIQAGQIVLVVQDTMLACTK